MGKKNEIQIIISAVDKASKVLKGTGDVLEKLSKVALIGVGAAATAVAGVGIVAFNLAKDAAEVEKTEKTWNSLSQALEGTNGNIELLRSATRGMVNDSDLMSSASKLMSMGLAKSNDEAAKLLEISTQLGSAMGVDATTAAEDFALMLANQSIPRLDTFGISSGKVRQRIEEMMAADKNLTREQAFLNATLEEAENTLKKVGEQGDGTAGNMARLQANVDNLKTEVGKKFLPVLDFVSQKLVDAWNDPKIQAGIDNVLLWIEDLVGDENSGIVGVITKLAEGDIAGAFDTAFGEGTWTKIQDFSKKFTETMQALGKIIDGLVKTVQFFIDLFDEAKAREAGTGYQRMMGITNTKNKSSYGVAGGGYQNGGSFIVPGFAAGGSATVPGAGSGDRPYLLGLEPGELVTVTPRDQVKNPASQPLHLELHIHSAINLTDKNYIEKELFPYIVAGVRQMRSQGAI